uniref:Uncharacterized protein n=1 Tax=Oryza brachyantha TaxID=4533 RepID=J3MVK5_ORYBR
MLKRECGVRDLRLGLVGEGDEAVKATCRDVQVGVAVGEDSAGVAGGRSRPFLSVCFSRNLCCVFDLAPPPFRSILMTISLVAVRCSPLFSSPAAMKVYLDLSEHVCMYTVQCQTLI